MKYYLIILGVISIIAFFMYAVDKRKAQIGAWRIPEKVLLGIAFFGGAAGALLGMVLCHHKTKHVWFWVVSLLGLTWQIGVLLFLWLK